MISYWREVKAPIVILWCYLLWYLVMTFFHFQGEKGLWVTALGVSVVVGVALVLATGGWSKSRCQQKPWEIFRLFFIPFSVSSFSALVKGQGFYVLLSPIWMENVIALLLCAVLVVWAVMIKKAS